MLPSVPRLETGCVNVHSKLMVIDDEPIDIGGDGRVHAFEYVKSREILCRPKR